MPRKMVTGPRGVCETAYTPGPAGETAGSVGAEGDQGIDRGGWPRGHQAGPEGTMLALSIRRPERLVHPSRTGWTEGELVALEVAVKDWVAVSRRVGLLRLRP